MDCVGWGDFHWTDVKGGRRILDGRIDEYLKDLVPQIPPPAIPPWNNIKSSEGAYQERGSVGSASQEAPWPSAPWPGYSSCAPIPRDQESGGRPFSSPQLAAVSPSCSWFIQTGNQRTPPTEILKLEGFWCNLHILQESSMQTTWDWTSALLCTVWDKGRCPPSVEKVRLRVSETQSM